MWSSKVSGSRIAEGSWALDQGNLKLLMFTATVNLQDKLTPSQRNKGLSLQFLQTKTPNLTHDKKLQSTQKARNNTVRTKSSKAYNYQTKTLTLTCWGLSGKGGTICEK